MSKSSTTLPTKPVIAIGVEQLEAARSIGVQRQAVFQWVQKGRVPANKVLILCPLVGHQVTPQQLRPDIFGQSATRQA